MSRPSRAVVDLGALRHNHAQARRRHGGRVLAVLKADAYGHGAVACARALAADGADGFAVAFADEALALRAAGIATPVLVLEGAFDLEELRALRAHGLWTVAHHEAQVAMLEQLSREAEPAAGVPGLAVWLKVDSGMRRAGLPPEAVRAAHARLQACAAVSGIVLMSHFARADEPDAPTTAAQVEAFDRATAGLPGARSLSNSAGLLAWPAARRDWGRCGIALYGADPLPAGRGGEGLRPVMTLESRVFAVRTLRPGDAVGYGGGFVADRDMRIGLVAMGYADGYPRRAPTGTPVAVNGQASRLVGRVSMDMLTVDLTGLPAAGIGSRVELWGPQVPVNAVAEAAGTIAYELLCNVKRVPRVYSDGARDAGPGGAADAAAQAGTAGGAAGAGDGAPDRRPVPA